MTFIRRKAARAAALAVCLAALAAPRARAQGEDPASHPGTLSMRADGQLGLVIASPAARRAAFTAVDAIVALLRADPAIAKPVGYSVSVKRVAGYTQLQPDGAPITARPVYGVNASLHYFALADDGHQISDQGGIVPFSVVVNMPGRYTDAEEISTELDHGPSILSDLRQTGEYRGHPIYNGECITVTGRAEPPFVPLTMERYYKLMIANFRRDSTQNAARQRKDDAAAASQAAAENSSAERAKRLADMQQTYEQLKKVDPQSAQQYLDAAKAADAEIQARARSGGQDRSAYADVVRRGVEGEGQGIANYQAKLDALSPEERRAPVAVITHHGTWSYRDDELADINDPESSPLVQLNPTFFDRTRPATAPQIVTVCIPGIQGLENKAYERLAEGSERDQERRSLEQQTRDAVRIRDHLDWAALEAMVKQ